MTPAEELDFIREWERYTERNERAHRAYIRRRVQEETQ